MNYSTILIVCMCMFGSCILVHLDDSVDLGNNYRYIQSNPKTIINNSGSKYKDQGEVVVGPHVVAYKFNETYIIAKTQNGFYVSDSVKVFKFWLVNKETGRVSEMENENALYMKLNELKIDLKFTH